MNMDYLRAKPFFLDDEAIHWVIHTLEKMSLEEKIGQLFCISPDLRDRTAVDALMQTYPGGVMLRPGETEFCIDAVNHLNKVSKLPLLIAADLEKGGNGVVNSGTTLGSPLGVAATDDVQNAARMGTVCAREGKAVGINWAFGPIVDIDTNFFNPITNVRTFGSDVNRVRKMGVAYIQAMQNESVAASAKHFPGDGVDFRDQHIVGSTNSLDVDDWEATYGEVYRACIETGVKSIMVGHIYQPAWCRKLSPDISDEELLPSSMNPQIIQGLLRNHLHFNGVIITDATTMTGFMQALPRQKLIPQVIISGVDMILFSVSLEEDIRYLMEAVQSGSLTMDRIHEAVSRILAMKASLGLHKATAAPLTVEAANKVIGCQQHRQWAKACADQSITLVKEEPGVLPLTPQRYQRVLYVPLEGKADEFAHNRIRSGAVKLFQQQLEQSGFALTVLEPGTEVYQNARIESYIKERFDLILYCANYGATSNQTVTRIQWPHNNMGWCPNFVHSIPTVFVSLENPYHLIDVPRVKTFVNAYSPSDETIRTVVEKLTGASKFHGISPVDPFCGLWEAKL